MKEYDIFVPLYFNDGSPVEAEKFQQLQERLLDRFGGLAFFPQPNKGLWRMAGVTYRDEIVIYRVIGPVAEEGRAFLAKLEEVVESRVRPAGNSDRRTCRGNALRLPAAPWVASPCLRRTPVATSGDADGRREVSARPGRRSRSAHDLPVPRTR